MAKHQRVVTIKNINFRADADLVKRLEKAVKREDRKLADVVRRLVMRALDSDEFEAGS